jgi:hypothetical protein
MSRPPLLLERHCYDTIHVTPGDGYDPSSGELGDVRTTSRYAHRSGDRRTWKVRVDVEIAPRENRPPPMYCVDIGVVGVFVVEPDIPEHQRARLVRVTGTSILFSGLRDFLMTITARCRWGPLMLPTASFVDLEPDGGDAGERLRERLTAALDERGPLRLRDLASVLDVDAGTLKPMLARLRREETLESVGRGPGTRYCLVGGGASRDGDAP